MSGVAGRFRSLWRDQEGQVVMEYALLMVVSMVLGFLFLEAFARIVDGLYGKMEGEVSRPSHF